MEVLQVNKQNSEEMQDEQLVFWEMCEKCYKMSDIQSQSWKIISGSGYWLGGRRRSSVQRHGDMKERFQATYKRGWRDGY